MDAATREAILHECDNVRKTILLMDAENTRITAAANELGKVNSALVDNVRLFERTLTRVILALTRDDVHTVGDVACALLLEGGPFDRDGETQGTEARYLWGVLTDDAPLPHGLTWEVLP